MRLLLITLMVSFILFSCAEKEEDETPSKALPDGTYLIGDIPTGETVVPARTLCPSNDSRPVLSTEVSTSANLIQLIRFNEFIVDSLAVTISGSQITKLWTRTSAVTTFFPEANTSYPNGYTDCTATWSGTILKNEGTTFQESGTYTIAWEPEGCAFEVHNYATTGGSVGNGTWIPNSATAYENAFVSVTSNTAQNPWLVTRSDQTYVLSMPPEVVATQTGYSCPDNDHAVYMVWEKQ